MTEYLKILGFTGVIGAIAAWLINKLAEQFFTNQAESFRIKLKHQATIDAQEHQIKYSKLYEERGNVVKEIYNLLLELETSLSELTSLFQGSEWATDTTRDEKVEHDINRLNKSLEQNRIFFSTELCDKISGILAESFIIRWEMWSAKSRQQANNQSHLLNVNIPDEQIHMPFDKLKKQNDIVKKNIANAKLEIAGEFRKIIGVS